MSNPKILSASLADESALARVAKIMGSASTSQAILDELVKRRAAGETVFVYDVLTANGQMMVVGPDIDKDVAQTS